MCNLHMPSESYLFNKITAAWSLVILENKYYNPFRTDSSLYIKLNREIILHLSKTIFLKTPFKF